MIDTLRVSTDEELDGVSDEDYRKSKRSCFDEEFYIGENTKRLI